MANSRRNRDQGLRGQRDAVEALKTWGLPAQVLAEQGRNDEPDVEVYDRDGARWVVECKRAQRVAVRSVLVQATGKGGGVPAVWWQPVTPPRGKSGMRIADGPPLAVVWGHDLAALMHTPEGRNTNEGEP
jgi:hypothetical protein